MTTGTVYLLHFSGPVAPGCHTAQHYLGYADDLGPRVNAHAHGHGARLTQRRRCFPMKSQFSETKYASMCKLQHRGLTLHRHGRSARK